MLWSLCLSQGLGAFAVRLFIFENNFIHDEEYHHGDAAVQDCGSDIVQPRRYKVTGYSRPGAVDGVHDAGHHTERQKIPHALAQDIPL